MSRDVGERSGCQDRGTDSTNIIQDQIKRTAHRSTYVPNISATDQMKTVHTPKCTLTYAGRPEERRISNKKTHTPSILGPRAANHETQDDCVKKVGIYQLIQNYI